MPGRLTAPTAALLALALLGSCDASPPSRNMSTGEVAGALGALTIEPGLWEVRSEIVDLRAPNLPHALRRDSIGPRGSARHCISAEQAARPSARFLAGRGGERCTYRDFSMRDGRMTGSMTCAQADGAAPIETRMNGRYGPQDYILLLEMRHPMPDGVTMIVDARTRGRRIGDCEQERGG